MADTILQKISKTLESLAELRVTTVVGDITATISVDPSGGVAVTPKTGAESVRCIHSEINLMQGDIITLVNAAYETAEPENTAQEAREHPVLKMHNAQIANGRDIVNTNVKMLLSLVKSISDSSKAGATLEKLVNSEGSGVNPLPEGSAGETAENPRP